MPYEITSNFTYLSSFVCFSTHLHHRSGNLPIYDIVLLPVFVPALNKGLTYLKIDSQKNAHTQPSTMLYDSILSILTTADAHFKQLEILYTANYRHPFFYYLSLLSLSIRKRNKITSFI